jgi:hypothetical protein
MRLLSPKAPFGVPRSLSGSSEKRKWGSKDDAWIPRHFSPSTACSSIQNLIDVTAAAGLLSVR